MAGSSSISSSEQEREPATVEKFPCVPATAGTERNCHMTGRPKGQFRAVLGLLVVFLGLLSVLDFVIGQGIGYAFRKQTKGRFATTFQALDRTEAKIIVLGDSRALHQIAPNVLTEALDMNVFNAGSDGQSIFYAWALQKAILRRYSPDVFIIVAGKDFLLLRPDRRAYERLSLLLPYYHDHPEIRPVIRLRSPLECWKSCSSLYRFNSVLLKMAGSFFIAAEADSGYIPIRRTMSVIPSGEGAGKTASVSFPPDPRKTDALCTFLEAAAIHGVLTVIVMSPEIRPYVLDSYSTGILQSAVVESNVLLLDYSADSRFANHREYFADAVHLNEEGSLLLSRDIAEQIRKRRQGKYR